MRPDRETNNAFVYCLRLAALKTAVRVVGVGTTWNHWHGVVIDRQGKLPQFLEYFHKLFAKHHKYDDPKSPSLGATIVAIGTTGYNSGSDNLHDLGFALKDDGSVVSWGDQYSPTGGTAYVDSTTLTKKVVAVAGGDNHALALYEDGTVGHWGRCWREECSLPESTLTGVVAVAAGGSSFRGFSVALKSDGTLVSAGNTAPSGVSAYWSGVFNTVPPLLTNIQTIAGGEAGLLALGKDGSLY